MAKIVNPVTFSDHFGIDAARLEAAGVLDPTLNVDTGLFIDPMLLGASAHQEISRGARATYETHFATVIKLLAASTAPGDVAWRSASKMLSFPEIKWTCLGYGAQSVAGSGSGSDMTGNLLNTAVQIVRLGVTDPDLFVAMSLFEAGFGPDRISDMTANVILSDLLTFNARVLPTLRVPLTRSTLRLRNGKTFQADLPVNPHADDEPVILVPADILRTLPVARDWSEIGDAAEKNEELRHRVNTDISAMWKVKTLKDKDTIKRWAMSDRASFETLLEMIRCAPAKAYDTQDDPEGEIFWRKLAGALAEREPLKLTPPARFDLAGVKGVVEQIIEQFRFLIEDRRLSEELYSDSGKVRPEKAAQRLFFVVAHAYCKANDLDLTPEADTGNGPVDFKVASGFTGRVLVEIKLSTNTKLLPGYQRQLAAYKTGEETREGYYVVVDVGGLSKKGHKLMLIKKAADLRSEKASPIVFVDGKRKRSASKL